MKIKNIFLTLPLAVFIAVGAMWSVAFAASIPVLSISAITSTSGSLAQISVSGADPDAAVILFYHSPTNSSSTVGLGLTNQYGTLSSTINPSTYNISAGSLVYVSVDGAQSASVVWPSMGGSNGGLSLSQTVLNMAAGQSSTVTATGVSGTLSITTDTNGGVATGQIYGNSIVITTLSNPGTAVITVCDSSNNCQNINVSVLTGAGTNFSVSSTAVNMNVGQSQTITLSGLGSFYISQNSNPSAVSATVSGDNLVLNGLSSGGSAITVCQSSNQCDTVNAYVNSTVNTTLPNTSSPSSSSVAPITPAAVSSNTVSTVTPLALSLSSFGISSNAVSNSFLGAGSALTLNFSANQLVNIPTVDVNGTEVSVNGSGSGPFSATYTLLNAVRMPIPIVIHLSNTAGVSTSMYFGVSNSLTPPTTAIPVVTASSGLASYDFKKDLYSGMTKEGVSNPDVLALQERLDKDGYFNGPKTGYFGPLTKAAVQVYQKAHGLSPVGVVGPETRNLLNRGI